MSVSQVTFIPVVYAVEEVPAPIVVEVLDLTSTSTIRRYIGEEAVKKNVNPELAQAIARAESRFDPKAKNPKSSASGVFQFINGTFKNYCINKYKLTDTMDDKNDVVIQVECALTMMTEPGGLNHWNESKINWGPSKGG